MRHDHLVRKVEETEVDSEHGGRWKAMTYINTAEPGEHLVLQKGRIDPAKPTLVRVHVLSIFHDLLREPGGRAGLIQHAMDAIAAEGAGVLVLIRDGRQDSISKQIEAHRTGEPNQQRDYGIGAQILVDLGVSDMVLLSGSHRSYIGLDGYGLRVVEERPLLPAKE